MNSINLILKGSPRSTNTLYPTMCRRNFPKKYLTNEGRALKKDYQRQIKMQYLDKPIKEHLKLTFIIFFATKRKADWDNFNKVACDAMTGLVYIDDSQIVDGRVIKNYDKINPRIEVEIIPLSN